MTQRLWTRRDWRAQYRDGTIQRPVMPFTEWWLHHSALKARPPVGNSWAQDAAVVRQLEDIGQARFGAGISYTYVPMPSGRLVQGHSVGRVGAHTYGHNTAGRAFVLPGNYQDQPPNSDQERAIAERMVLDHRAGLATTHVLSGGHRDVSPTSCPGDAAYARIPAINALARRLWAEGWPHSTTPTPIGEEQHMMLVQVEGQDPVWVTNGLERRHLPNRKALDNYRAARKTAGLPPLDRVHVVKSEQEARDAFGPVVGGVPA